jgi:hypothetical protein
VSGKEKKRRKTAKRYVGFIRSGRMECGRRRARRTTLAGLQLAARNQEA